MFDFTALKKTVLGLGGQVAALRAEIETLRRQRDELEAAPASREDVRKALHAYVQSSADRYAVLVQRALAPLTRKPALLSDPARVASVFSLSGAAAPGGQPVAGAHDLVLAGLASELVGAALDNIVGRMPWPEGGEGLPADQRAAEVAKLDARIAALLEQERELVGASRAAGVLLPEA